MTLSDKISADEIAKIHKEIENAAVIVTDSEKIIKDIEAGIVSRKTASLAAGYPKGEDKLAEKDAERKAAQLIEAQTALTGRGVDNNINNAGARGADTSISGRENARTEKTSGKVKGS